MKVYIEEKKITQAKLLIGSKNITMRIPESLPTAAKEVLKILLRMVADRHIDQAPLKASYKIGTPYIFLKSILTDKTVAVEQVL